MPTWRKRNRLGTVTTGVNWDGTAGSGFSSVPTDPVQTDSKPVCRLLVPDRQTITKSMVIGAFALASLDGSMAENSGLSHVNIHCEGGVVRVDEPTLRTFHRYDGRTYQRLGWWARVKRPSGTSGTADVYIEAVPADPDKQTRIEGPFPFEMHDTEHDFEVTVNSAGGADYTNMSDALSYLRLQGADRPLIKITGGSTYTVGAAGAIYAGKGRCKITADVPVTFKDSAPSLAGDFTRFRPQYDRLHFQGKNITIDFVETLEFYSEDENRHHWLDRVRIRQSRGREDLWRKIPRNIIPALFRHGAIFTDCYITDVNDWGDKTPLARGNITFETFGDALQGAKAAFNNEIEDHSCLFYYTNVDAIDIRYTGTGSTPQVSFPGANGANGKDFTLHVNGGDVASFEVLVGEQDFRDDTNYTVQSVADFINAQADWSATVLDDSRAAAFLTKPGSTNGSGFSNLDVGVGGLVLPTHFDLHADIYQLPQLAEVERNIVFDGNRGWLIRAQLYLVQATGDIQDAYFGNDAWHTILDSGDEELRSQMSGDHRNVIFAHISMGTQRWTTREDGSGDGQYTADADCMITNCFCRDILPAGGGAFPANLVVKDNHIWGVNVGGTGDTGTTEGGDWETNQADPANGDFTPTGDLESNIVVPAVFRDMLSDKFPAVAAKGAVASADTGAVPPPPAPSLSVSTLATGSSSGSQSASTSAFSAAGENRRVIALMGAGVGDQISAASATITGTGGTVSMPQLFFSGTNNANPANALDVGGAFEIEEADLPGDGPYTVEVTVTSSQTPARILVAALAVKDAPDDPVFVQGALNAKTAAITPSTEQSLVLALMFETTGSGSLDWTEGVDFVGSPFVFSADALLVGSAVHGTTELTVTANASGRAALGVLAYPNPN